MLSKFISIPREQDFLLPPSIDELIPEDHIVRFVIETIDRLDFSEIEMSYGYRGEKAYAPNMMTALLFYGYINGIYSSRKLEKATYENLPFMFITGNLHPDHTTIAAFRKRLNPFLKSIFSKVLEIAAELGFKSVGIVALDGTKVFANASKHKALSYGYANTLEAKIQTEIDDLFKRAEEADNNDSIKKEDIPKEIKRRHNRLKKIDEAKKEIERRHNEENEKKGKSPKDTPPSEKAQVNLTDPESRIMYTAKYGFQQCYNAQIGVDVRSRLILGAYVTQNVNDKQEVVPLIKELRNTVKVVTPSGELKIRDPKILLADTGYHSEKNIKYCKIKKVIPIIAEKREEHNGWYDKNVKSGKPNRRERLYSKRKSTVETVFGVIKKAMGFSGFHLRGKENVETEFNIVAICYNLKCICGMLNRKIAPITAK